MPIQIINTIYCRLIGLVIGEQEDQDFRQLKKEWENCYYNLDAFFVPVEKENTAEQIARNVTEEIRKQGLLDIGNKPVICSIFIGLHEEPDLKRLAAAENALKILSDGLDFVLPLTLHFGYLGELWLADKGALRENVKKVIRRENVKTDYMLLVAKAPLMDQDSQSHWKAVISLMDSLRRCNAPASEIEHYDTGAIGFLGYDQYDEKQVEDLEREKAHNARLLGDAGETELRRQYRAYLQKVEKQVRDDLKITEDMMPMHPDMNVSGKLKQWAASKDKNKEYKNAQNSTKNALVMTGERLRDSVRKAYEEQSNCAGEVLENLFNTAEVGILLQQNKEKLKEIFDAEEQRADTPMLPELKYDDYMKDKCRRAITDYLERTMDCAIAAEKQKLVAALCTAAEKIDPTVIKEKSDKLLHENAAIENQLHVIMSKTVFENMAKRNDIMPSSAISAVSPGGQLKKYTVTDDEALSKELNAFGVTPVYSITPAPGVETKKMWHVGLFVDEAADARLEELI